MRLFRNQPGLLAAALAMFLRMLGRTWRVRKQGFPSAKPEPQFIDAVLHGDMLFYISIYRGERCVTMVSEHRDGEIIARVVEKFGGTVVRGSSTRGGARAYLEMLKRHKDKGMAVAPDGPRGPKGVVQEGVIKLASDSNRAIRPHGYAAKTVKRFDSWDEFQVPYPFTRIVEFVGDPLHIPRKADRATRQELAKDLERRLEEAQRQAQLALDRWVRRPTPEVGAEDHDTQASA